MPTTVTVRDESTGGDPLHEFALELLTERLTVRELIRSRVYQEVQDYNRRRPPVFRSLFRPTEAEEALNGPRPTAAPIDWHRQFDRAVRAFEGRSVLVLVDGRQADSLDEEFDVRPGSCVTFLRLTPLAGG